MLQKVTEANITIQAPKNETITAKLPVFYNPVMKLNRDSSVLLLKAIDKKEMSACDLLAGSGIRSLRLLAELPKGKLKSITINDYKEDAKKVIGKHLKDNKKLFQDKNIEINITSNEANILMLNSTGFDYIDIDPFGTPNPFLDAASRRISRDGILAVTATDTSGLAGTFPKACKRKYWATPDRGPLKHESGIRILIRKVQLIGAQYEKALTPIFSYSKDHYMRVYFRCRKGKSHVDEILKQHNTYNEAGPMWVGRLWDEKLAEKMYELSDDEEYSAFRKFFLTIKEESIIDAIGFHDIHNICKRNSLEVPAFIPIMDAVKKKDHKISRTHFSDFGLRSSIPEKDLLKIIKKVIKNK